jgi:hypothetical protein
MRGVRLLGVAATARCEGNRSALIPYRSLDCGHLCRRVDPSQTQGKLRRRPTKAKEVRNGRSQPEGDACAAELLLVLRSSAHVPVGGRGGVGVVGLPPGKESQRPRNTASPPTPAGTWALPFDPNAVFGYSVDRTAEPWRRLGRDARPYGALRASIWPRR